jgi:hypothetical protein
VRLLYLLIEQRIRHTHQQPPGRVSAVDGNQQFSSRGQ